LAQKIHYLLPLVLPLVLPPQVPVLVRPLPPRALVLLALLVLQFLEHHNPWLLVVLLLDY
jgi:hypothetical protein